MAFNIGMTFTIPSFYGENIILWYVSVSDSQLPNISWSDLQLKLYEDILVFIYENNLPQLFLSIYII